MTCHILTLSSANRKSAADAGDASLPTAATFSEEETCQMMIRAESISYK